MEKAREETFWCSNGNRFRSLNIRAKCDVRSWGFKIVIVFYAQTRAFASSLVVVVASSARLSLLSETFTRSRPLRRR
jgi:hypothetical protein